MVACALLVVLSDTVQNFLRVVDLVEANACVGHKHHRFVLAGLLLNDLLGEVAGELRLVADQITSNQLGLKIPIVGLRICCALEQRKRLPNLTLLEIEQTELALGYRIAWC